MGIHVLEQLAWATERFLAHGAAMTARRASSSTATTPTAPTAATTPRGTRGSHVGGNW